MNYPTSTAEKSDFSAEPLPAKKVNLLLTGRGILLSCFLAYLFYNAVLGQIDIIASVFVYALCAYLLLAFFFNLLLARRLKEGLSVRIFQPEGRLRGGNNELAVAGQPALLVMRLDEFRILPGYFLEIQIVPAREGIKFARHILTGKIEAGRCLSEEVVFPHRGYWEIAHVRFFLSDKLGLTYFQWTKRDDVGALEMEVQPQSTRQTSVPVISSSSRIGDTLPDLKERRGDPYDLKVYHPADGVRRILWKVYAKTGELISRHPEASMTPEGQVLCFAMAAKTDEHVCAASLAYLAQLEKLNLDILFTCLGAGERETANSADTARQLMIDSVWDIDEQDQEAAIRDVQILIEAFNARSAGTNINKIVVFCSQTSLSDQKGLEMCTALGRFLTAQGIVPYFSICQRPEEAARTDNGNQSIIARIFLHPAVRNGKNDLKLYYNFLNSAKVHNWVTQEEKVI